MFVFCAKLQTKYPQKTSYKRMPDLSLFSLHMCVCVFSLIVNNLSPCRNAAKTLSPLILRGAFPARQLPFTADERVCGRQLHYLFIIYDSISLRQWREEEEEDGGRRRARGPDKSSPRTADAPLSPTALSTERASFPYLFDGILITKIKMRVSLKNGASAYWNII